MPIYKKPVNSPYDVSSKKSSQPSNTQSQSQQTQQTQQIQQSQGDNYDDNGYKKMANMLPLEQNKLVDLQVFQPPQPKNPNPYKGKKPFMPIEPIALTTPYNPPQYQSYVNQMIKDFYTPFIYKDYNIQIGAPTIDHEKAYRLFEDMAPPAEYFSSYNNLQERCNLVGFIRGNFVKKYDGESVELGSGINSLNSRLNYLGINSFDPDHMANPYTNLGDGILLYTSCYPIIKDKKNDATMCHKSSVGINVRIYYMSINAYISQFSNSDGFKSVLDNPNSQDALNMMQNFDYNKDNEFTYSYKYSYECWRENFYYEFIRLTICNNNISPNFIQSYCYFQTLDPQIGFKFEGQINKQNKPPAALTILTESPNYSLFVWGSNVQITSGNTSRMTHSGFKTPKLWCNVLEQIVISFYVMFKYKFTFRDMNIKSNFFIKILNKSNNMQTYWKYKVKGIDYYISNFGNLLLVDTSYENLQNTNCSGGDQVYKDLKNAAGNYNFKCSKTIMSEFYNSKSKNFSINFATKDDYLRKIYFILYENMKTVLKQNTFDSQSIPRDTQNNSTSFVGVPGSGEGINIWNEKINSINNVLNNHTNFINNSSSISDIERKFNELFSDLLIQVLKDRVHNRVGTYLRDNEINYIGKDSPTVVKKGDLIVHEVRFETFVFVLFVKSIDAETYECITTNEQDEFIIKEISKSLTYPYMDISGVKLDLGVGEIDSNSADIIDDTFNID